MKKVIVFVLFLSLAFIFTGCQGPVNDFGKCTVTCSSFGIMPDGQTAKLFTLTNKNGMTVKITNYGAIVTHIIVPDAKGDMADVALGHDNVNDYIKGHPYFGAIVGRYGNRIAKGKFTLDGKQYTLATNNDANHLHGGEKGFDKVIWDAAAFADDFGAGVRFSYLSKDMEEGYPGNLNCSVRYTLTNNNELKLDYEATTDKATVVNLTHHSYFNLAGQGTGDILSHEIMIDADYFTPVDEGLIPTGIESVKGTPMDFTKSTAIGKRVDDDYQQLIFGKGYDHNWIINNADGSMKLAARVTEPTSGRIMEVYTTEPGIQFYCGNFLDGTNIGKGNKVYKHRYGFCLETQHFPDSPNQKDFPSVVLRPGQLYRHSTIYKFLTK
ncbi:MAG: galactose mutarotase [Phycisphaerae bacterium]|nr:galactose mutarotase [Phycisphaerae bacterium]